MTGILRANLPLLAGSLLIAAAGLVAGLSGPTIGVVWAVVVLAALLTDTALNTMEGEQ